MLFLGLGFALSTYVGLPVAWAGPNASDSAASHAQQKSPAPKHPAPHPKATNTPHRLAGTGPKTAPPSSPSATSGTTTKLGTKGGATTEATTPHPAATAPAGPRPRPAADTVAGATATSTAAQAISASVVATSDNAGTVAHATAGTDGEPTANGPIAPSDAASMAVLTDAIRRELSRSTKAGNTTAHQQATTALVSNTAITASPKPAAAVVTPAAAVVAAAAVAAPAPVSTVPMAAAAAVSATATAGAAVATAAATTAKATPVNPLIALLQKLVALFNPPPKPKPPVAVADTVTGTEGTAVTGNVLTNDTDPAGKTLSAQLVTGPKDGTLTLSSNGSFTYTPKTSFTGTDSFTYTASDGTAKSAVTTVTVSITAPPSTAKPIVGVQGIDSFVGLSAAQVTAALAAAKAAGATSVRIAISWYAVEWTKGTFYWSSIDQEVQEIEAAGMTPMAMIYDTPSWLSGNANPHTPPANAAQDQLFGQFAATVAQRYAGEITDFEIWNEENIPRFWTTPNAAAYTQVLKAAYTAIKAVDPDDVVIAGGLSPDVSGIDPTTFVQQMYAAGAKGYFDALAYHQYSYPDVPTIAPVEAIHDVMVANGDGNKQIWITEAGAPTGSGAYAVSDAVQAQTVAALLEEAQQYSYVGPTYFYTIMDTGTDPSDIEDNFGLIAQDGTPKLSYDVLKQFMTGGGSADAASTSA